jgi:catechol 2,3-dioxygenase-like lactoylglutathione lyase family enzyme
MELHGLLHVTVVTGKTQTNVDFYTEVLVMRLVKKTVNPLPYLGRRSER